MKKNSKPEAVGPATLFGPPMLLEGENRAAYAELIGRIYAAVKPVDVLDEMFIADIAFLEWEILRGRRLKFNFIWRQMLQALTHFLVKHLEFAQYREEFAEDLAAILENTAADDEAKNLARKLAHRCALDEADAVDQVDGILRRNQKTMDCVLNRARKQKAEQLTAKFARSEPRAIAVVQQQLADAGLSLDALTVKGIQGQSLETIERFDRLIATAEIRRNASLREIDRRRTALSEAVRRTVQKIEHDELKVIETTPIRGKSAA